MVKKILFLGVVFVLLILVSSFVFAQCPGGYDQEACVVGYHDVLYTDFMDSVMSALMPITSWVDFSFSRGMGIQFYSYDNPSFRVSNQFGDLVFEDVSGSNEVFRLSHTGDVVIDLSRYRGTDVSD